eukprot:TRINITY_DN10712_c0_g1_i1.p1 TRINITY_DN10712_c0_g1~~TRINITY_DN10712_c0_g1_i1.p1  ORF type:complete len:306 (+),score=49.46 TRINITY_DN10712_c0_g1_i1:48-965(+)
MSGYGSVALTTDTEGSRFEPGLVGAPPVPGVKIEGSLTLRLRGLPYKATQLEIEEWLRGGGVNITPGTVVIQYGTDGRPSGQAFVEVLSQDDVDAGLAMSNQHMGTRYIEVYSIAGSASEAAQSQATLPRPNRSYAVPYNEDCVIRLRGLPYSATEQDIANFLVGTSICQQGIHLVFNHQNRPSGEAYVELQSTADVDEAMRRDRKRLGERYIEVFRSSFDEMHGKNSRGGHGGVRGYDIPLGDRFSPYGGGGKGYGGKGFGRYDAYGGKGGKGGKGYDRFDRFAPAGGDAYGAYGHPGDRYGRF